MNKAKVLFLCVSNSARSQMAEAFLRSYAGDRYEAYSAGFEAKEIHPLTRQVMDEIGIDIGEQRAKGLREFMGRIHFGYLITVCTEAEPDCPTTFPDVGQKFRWNFEDPAAPAISEEAMLQRFRDTRDRIRQRVKDWVDHPAQRRRHLRAGD